MLGRLINNNNNKKSRKIVSNRYNPMLINRNREKNKKKDIKLRKSRRIFLIICEHFFYHDML